MFKEIFGSRLQGIEKNEHHRTGAETASTDFAFDYQTGWGNIGGASANFISWITSAAPPASSTWWRTRGQFGNNGKS
jgi:hypothetical protein